VRERLPVTQMGQERQASQRHAFGLWLAYPGEFRQLAANCMRADYSWSRPGQDYLNIYDYIRHK